METKDVISDNDIDTALYSLGFNDVCVDEGRLMLLELLSKAGAGFYNSHTEEQFLSVFKVMRADRTPNKFGLRFLCSMLYNSSDYRPVCFEFMQNFRKTLNHKEG